MSGSRLIVVDHVLEDREVAAIIRWYCRRRSGTALKVLAAEAAAPARRRRRAARAEAAHAVTQAARRIRAGLRWFDAQFRRDVERSR